MTITELKKVKATEIIINRLSTKITVIKGEHYLINHSIKYIFRIKSLFYDYCRCLNCPKSPQSNPNLL